LGRLAGMHGNAMRVALLVASLALAGVFVGCAQDRPGSRGVVAPRGSVSAAPAFTVVRIEIHPLTRVLRDDVTGETRIEAHVEFFDAWGDTVKDLGELQFELFRGAGEPSTLTQELVWRKDLTDPDANSRQYDAITRTYTIPLLEAPEWLGRGGRATLLAAFTTADGRRLVATRRLEP